MTSQRSHPFCQRWKLKLILFGFLCSFDPQSRVAGWLPKASPLSQRQDNALSRSTRENTALYLMDQQLGEFECLANVGSAEERRVRCLDYSNRTDPIPYQVGWDMQKQFLEAQLQRIQENDASRQFTPDAEGSDTIIMLQHEPVYTLGTASDETFIRATDSKVPIVRMDRGGEVTFHGPGQLTVYPILDLRSYKQDIHWYMRALEEAIILTLKKYGIPAAREDGITGVWVDNCKVAAVGIKCRRWVTMHGLAVNVEETSLAYFDGIVACGLDGRKVGCLNQFLTTPTTVAEFALQMKESLQDIFAIQCEDPELDS